MEEIYVVGVGMTPFGRYGNLAFLSLAGLCILASRLPRRR